MWDEIMKYLPDFQSAVLTSVDAEGYLLSIRCRPRPEPETKLLRMELPASLPVRSGPASLLCHRHDENLWNQKSFLVRGSLTQETQEGWSFRPQQFLPGAGIGGLIGLVRFIYRSRREAKRYLQRRGLPRPPIPWEQIKAIKAQGRR